MNLVDGYENPRMKPYADFVMVRAKLFIIFWHKNNSYVLSSLVVMITTLNCHSVKNLTVRHMPNHYDADNTLIKNQVSGFLIN